MQRKTIAVSGIKTADLAEGMFEGYASCFDNVDLVGDIVRRGAFATALKSDAVIPLIWEHQTADPRAYVGEVTSARETDEGLAIVGRFDLDTEHGNAAYRQVKGRRVTGLSIGYVVDKSRKSAEGTELLALHLLEVSLVARPANDQARVTAAKSAGTPTTAIRARLTHLAATRYLKGDPPVFGTSNATRLENLTKGLDEQLALIKEIVDKADELQRDLTADETAQVDAAMTEAKKAQDSIALVKSDAAVLDQARALVGAIGTATGISAPIDRGRLGLSSKSAPVVAASLVKSMPTTDHGTKALVGGQRTTSLIVEAGPFEQGRPPQSILDVLTARQVTPNYGFLRQTARTNNAAPVAEGAVKPTSAYGLTSIDGRLRVVAHISEQVPHYVLSDNSALEEFVAAEMLFGLRAGIEAQVLTGDGTGENLTGILGTSGLQVQAFTTDVLTSVRKSITKLQAAGYSPDVLAISATDWEAVELLSATNGATDVRGVPVDAVAQRLWGVQAVISTALPAKTAILLDSTAVAVDSDGAVDTRWSDAVGDDFSRNYVRCRVEGRFGCSVFKPGGIVRIATAA